MIEYIGVSGETIDLKENCSFKTITLKPISIVLLDLDLGSIYLDDNITLTLGHSNSTMKINLKLLLAMSAPELKVSRPTHEILIPSGLIPILPLGRLEWSYVYICLNTHIVGTKFKFICEQIPDPYSDSDPGPKEEIILTYTAIEDEYILNPHLLRKIYIISKMYKPKKDMFPEDYVNTQAIKYVNYISPETERIVRNALMSSLPVELIDMILDLMGELWTLYTYIPPPIHYRSYAHTMGDSTRKSGIIVHALYRTRFSIYNGMCAMW